LVDSLVIEVLIKIGLVGLSIFLLSNTDSKVKNNILFLFFKL
jgi:hypothetical protein